MDNIVTTIFEVESEAFQYFTKLRNVPFGPGYIVAEAALVKRSGDAILVADTFDAAGVTTDDTLSGMMLGSLVGILGGPIGVLLGASIGGLAGNMVDTDDKIDSYSILEVTASKLYDNEAAIIALVQEDEPAYDSAFAGVDVTIVRHFAADVYDEVERARELELQLATELKAQLRSEVKAAKKEKRAQRKAKIGARFEAAKQRRVERKEALDEAKDIANAQYLSSTQEMYS